MNLRTKRRIYAIILLLGALALFGVGEKLIPDIYSTYKINLILGIGLVWMVVAEFVKDNLA